MFAYGRLAQEQAVCQHGEHKQGEQRIFQISGNDREKYDRGGNAQVGGKHQRDDTQADQQARLERAGKQLVKAG